MIGRFFLFLLLSVSLSEADAQLSEVGAGHAGGSVKLYTYPEMLRAYAKGTRSRDGRPGEHYWQNRTKYTISAVLNPVNGEIRGAERIEYFNNSPDSLDQLVIRTYPDFYKCANVKDYTINEADCSAGMNISSIRFDNDSAAVYRRAGTNAYVEMPKRMAPHTRVVLAVEWNFTLPKKTTIREGVFHQTSFFVAYWYPQVSVYDDWNGWDYFNYTGLQEFYNDFNDYDVTITAPSNYLVWATGDWTNASQVLDTKYYRRFTSAAGTDSVIHIVDSDSRRSGRLTKGDSVCTFHFVADTVCDFSFAASDSYLWDRLKVGNGKKDVFVNIVYHPLTSGFPRLALPARKVIGYLSTVLPGVPYPYPQLTIFDGDGGMEYAMMVNQAFLDDEQGASVMAHEITHTYFPFYVASNERRYAWMDEGLAQTLPDGCTIAIGSKVIHPQQMEKGYIDNYVNTFMGSAMESPPMELSINQKGGTYYFSAYARPWLAFTYLQQLLGKKKFGAVIRAYVERWKYKHPSPYDLFYTFNDVAGRDLNWFWRPWFFDHAFPDISIRRAMLRNGRLELRIGMDGTMPVPVEILCEFKDGTKMMISRNVDIWERSSEVRIIKRIPPGKALSKVSVNTDMIPDIDRSNNSHSFE